MKLFLTLMVAVALALTGLPRPSWNDNVHEIVAFPPDRSLTILGEALDDSDENHPSASTTVDIQPKSFDPCLGALASTARSQKEQRFSKDDLRIYTLNRAFRI